MRSAAFLKRTSRNHRIHLAAISVGLGGTYEIIFDGAALLGNYLFRTRRKA